MIKSYKYKLKPTIKQQTQLNQFFGCARFVYNWGLNQKVEQYKQNKQTIGYVELAHQLTLLKKQEDTKWLNDCANVCLQQSLRNLDSAFVRFFREKKGFPKFKSKKKSKDSIKFNLSVKFDFENWYVTIPKIGKVKLCKNKIFNTVKCKIGTLTVSKDKCNDFWCSVIVDDLQPKPLKTKIVEETSVGIDLGIKDYVILSDGTKYDNPKYLEKYSLKLKHLQKVFSRTKLGSKNHEKMRLKIAKLHRRITNMRNDFTNKLSSDLIKRFDTICLENLNIKKMLKNYNLSNSIQSAAWNKFVNQLQYKSELYGKNIIFIGRFEPSSKTCHKCGYIKSDLTLNERKWICPNCGELLDRDINAAINIKDFGLHKQNLINP